jgi:hypothetical protein
LELNFDLDFIAPVVLLTAVVLFIHGFAETTRRVFASIGRYKPERLYIFADVARADKVEGSSVRSFRVETENVDWDCEVFRHYSSENHGPSKSIIRGLDKVFESESSAIILEDDCLPSSAFFPLAEKLLHRLEHNNEVAIALGANLSGVRTSTGYTHQANLMKEASSLIDFYIPSQKMRKCSCARPKHNFQGSPIIQPSPTHPMRASMSTCVMQRINNENHSFSANVRRDVSSACKHFLGLTLDVRALFHLNKQATVGSHGSMATRI